MRPAGGAADPYAFYREVPARRTFGEVLDAGAYRPLPDAWWIVLGDVVDSTGAIARGAYKEVNLVGGAILAAARNALGTEEFPYVFGGDGATLAVPPEAVDALRPALEMTRGLAAGSYGLDLRVGLVRMAEVRAAGREVGVARFLLSADVALAALGGDGLAWVEALVKHPERGASHRISGLRDPSSGVFQGLECRWAGIPSPRGETLALLAVATGRDEAADLRTYRELLATLDAVIGLSGLVPVADEQLRLESAAGRFEGEVGLRARSKAGRWLARQRIRIETAGGRWLMARGWRTPGTDWGRYRGDVVRHSDYRKFDGALRMILAATTKEREALTAWLDSAYAAGRLAYGLHVAREALMTCLIFSRERRHVHFLDAAEGGYARAAADLKRRLARRL